MQKNEQIQLAAMLLRLSEEDADRFGSVIEELGAFFVSIPEKGGSSIIVGSDGTVLYADSSIGYTRQLQEFKFGRRTPLEEFE